MRYKRMLHEDDKAYITSFLNRGKTALAEDNMDISMMFIQLAKLAEIEFHLCEIRKVLVDWSHEKQLTPAELKARTR